MREYGQIQCAFWQSDDAITCTDAGKLLATYLLTGPHSNGIGCYRCPDGYVMADLGWSAERVSEGFEELSRNGFAYRFDGVVFIPNFLRWNRVANGNVATARMAEFDALPKGDAKAHAARAILKYVKHLSAESRTVLQTVSETVPDTLGERYGNQNHTLPREKQDPTKKQSSLRSDSSSPDGDDPGERGELELKPPPADRKPSKAERIRQIAEEAQAAFNAILAKPHGVLSACSLLNKDRLKAVEKCLPTARAMCLALYGSERITPKFWAEYFAEVATDDWHSGRTCGGPGHENWKPDFEYLLREGVMAKLFDRAMAEAA